jgi:Dehydrogenase E1 component
MSRAADEARLESAVGDGGTPGHQKELLRQMLLIRRFEEKCVELYSAAEIRGFVHLYIGEEAVAVGVNQALTPDDAIVSTYREHGHALTRGLPLDAVMAYGGTEAVIMRSGSPTAPGGGWSQRRRCATLVSTPTSSSRSGRCWRQVTACRPSSRWSPG